LLTTGLVTALAASVVLVWPQSQTDDPAPPKTPEPSIAQEQVQVAEPAPTIDAPKREERANSAPMPPPPGQEFELEPPYRILDGLTLAAGSVTVTLDGLEGPQPGAACRAPDGALWACGLQARAALNNAIRQRRLLCRGTSSGEETIRAVCKVDGEDLANLLVREGWARPTSAGSGMQTALAEAREQRRGLWNGDWTIASVSAPAQEP
jgi:endonuclease YncB( thermonuclease family)